VISSLLDAGFSWSALTAALGEGMCPVCKVSLEPWPDHGMDLRLHGFCKTCRCCWHITASKTVEMHGYGENERHVYVYPDPCLDDGWLPPG
jgi:hypothetical protein